MKGPTGYRLSPNEEARLLKETREALRKQRLLQVRQQAKVNAAKIRREVASEKKKQLDNLAKQVENEFQGQKEEKLRTLTELYEHSLQNVGQGHTIAAMEECKEDNRDVIKQVDMRRARIRHHNALRKLHHDQAERDEQDKRHIVARRQAVDVEKERAAEIAARPAPPPDPVKDISVPKSRPVKFTDLDAFSATHYHIPEICYVERAQPEEQNDARQDAQLESEKITEAAQQQKCSTHEQQEKARLRHKHALYKEILKNDYTDMLHDLSDLQRADMHRRQKVVANIPKQIFIPPHRRLEEKEDAQREMEGAFEDMYLKETEFQGDLSLALDPHPAPATPTCSELLDLSVQEGDLSLAEEPQPAQPQYDRTKSSQQNLNAQRQTPDGLRRLVSRIKVQRQGWCQKFATVDGHHNIEPSPGVKSSSSGPSPSQHAMTDSSDTASQITGVASSLSQHTLSTTPSSTHTGVTDNTQTSETTGSTVTGTSESTATESVLSTTTFSEDSIEQGLLKGHPLQHGYF